jgi:hypothetical protein
MKQTIVLRNAQTGHTAYSDLWPRIKAHLMAGHTLVVSVKPETRSDAQNRRMWAMLTDISRQVVWHGLKLSPEDWKHMFSSQIQQLRSVPNFDNTGFILLGQSTSQMTRSEMADLQTLMEAFGAQHGVRFTAPEYEGA